MGGGQTSQGKRPMETASDPEVRLCFRSQDGCKICFKVSQNTPMQELLKAYCEGKKIEYRTTVFLHDGKRVRRKGTVDQVGLVDQDEIDVMMYQNGGGPSKYVI